MKRAWLVLFSWLLAAPIASNAAGLSEPQQVQVACTLLLHDLANAYSERDAARGAALFTPKGVWEVATIDITAVDKTTATGVSYALVLAADRPREDTKPHGTYEPIQMNGFTFVVVYRDSFKLTKDGWRLARRITNRVFTGPGQTTP